MSTYRRLEDLEVYMAHLKSYESRETYEQYRARYQERIRMPNGMERTLEKNLPEEDRRWPESLREESPDYGDAPTGYPDPEP